MQDIIDNGDLRRYRTELPNMCDDDLDPYQYRLYAHYKRWCGANGGYCLESVRRTAKICRMSITKVIEVRQWLHENGWIVLYQNNLNGMYTVQIVDRWAENFTRYTEKSVPNTEHSVLNLEQSVPNMEYGVPDIEQSVLNLEQSVPNMEYGVPDIEQSVLNMEHSVLNLEQSVPNIEQSVLNMEHKKELFEITKEITKEEGAATPTAAAADPPEWYEAEPEPPAPAAPTSPAPTVKGMTANPVIAMYRDAFLRFPSKAQMRWLLAQNVTDLRRWRDVLTLWVGKGWNSTNLAGMVDLYQNSQRIQELLSYQSSAQVIRQTAKPPAQAERVAPGWHEWLEELNPTGGH